MRDHFLCGVIRRVYVVCACALMGSCYYMPPEIVQVPPEAAPVNFKGITDLLPPAAGPGQMRILFIHGMGLDYGCDADELLFHLAKALQVTQQTPPAIDQSEPPVRWHLIGL
ncbi:MAG: hypothetical protein ACLP4V_16235 [Methylocella sp.]